MAGPDNFNFQDLLTQAATGSTASVSSKPISDVAAAKKEAVDAASVMKKEAMGPGVDSAYNIALSKSTDEGQLDRNELENDIRDMPTNMLYEKYGAQANDLMLQRAAGSRAVRDDQEQARAGGDIAYDSVTDLGIGFANGLGGLAALATSAITPTGSVPINPLEALGMAMNKGADLGALVTGQDPIPGGATTAAGVKLAQLMDTATKAVRSTQSDELNTLRGVQESTNQLADRDTEILYKKDVEEQGETLADISKVGREVVSSIESATDDSAVLGSGTMNALGSLLSAGPVVAVARKGAVSLLGTEGKLAQIGQKIASAAGIGAIEAGGAYSQTAVNVSQRSHEQLMDSSEDYRTLIDAGVAPDVARNQLADDTGQFAATVTAPLAIATAGLVSKFDGSGIKNIVAKAPGYIAKEPLEEGIQGGVSQTAQNLAIQENVDPEQELTEGVGRQIGEGALYGLGMTAALGASSGAVQAVGLAGKGTLAVGKTALGMLAKRVDKQLQANKEASPLADKTVLTAATEAQAAAEVDAPVMRQAVEETDATPEQKAEANSYIDSLVAANTYDVEADATPELLKPIMGDVKNRVEAIQRVAQYVNTVEEGSPAQMEAGVYLYDLVNGYQKLINSDPEALQKVPQDHPARTIVGQYVGLMDALGKTPKVMDAIGKIQDALEKREAKAVEITDEMLETPEGQKAVNDVINVAILAPEKGNLETTERVLNQVSRGKLQISPEQKAALDTSVAMLRAVAAADKEAQALGETDPVSLNISSVEGEKGPSLTQHAKGIMSAWKAGDRDTAAARLVEFHNFAKGMSNKLGAINSHFAAGDPKAVGVGYQIYVGGKLKDSPKVWRVYPDNVGSIKMAQKVGREAKMLADVYNNLVTAFPDLKGNHLDFVPLDPRLGIPAEDFVAKYNKTAVADTAKTATKTVPSPVNDTRIPVGVSSLDDTALATRLRNTNTNDPRYEIYQAEMDRREDEAQLANEKAEREEELGEGQAPATTPASVTEPNTPANPTTGKVVPVVKEKPVEVIVVEESLEEPDFTIDFDTAMQEAMVRDDAPMFLLEDTTTEAPAAPIVPTSVDLTQKLDVQIDEVPLTADELAAPIMEAPIDSSGEGVAALFPRIMGVVKGVFSTSYKLPKVQKTRTIGTETPIAFLRSALSNSANFTNLIGSSPKGKYDAKTAAAYSSLLDRAEEIAEKLKQNLANKLATDYKKGAKGTTIRELALGLKQIKTAKGVVYDPFRAADTKSMSITEQINNTLEYNPELLEGAVLAGIQWFIDSDTRSDNLDEADVASMTGIERAFVSSSMVDALNTGTSLLDAKAALTSKILNYWGLSKENSGPIGYQTGVPEAIAGEIMRTFKELGWLNTDYYGVTKGGQFVKYDADGKPPLGMVKTLIQIRTEPLSEDSAVRAYPNALDMAVLIEPEEKIIIGDEGELAVSPTQMRNPDVKNTPQQLKTIANEQNTRYFLNLPMVNLFMAMGIDELKEAFIQVDTKNTLMNKNHRMSVEGQTQALASAFQSLTDTAARVDGYAEGGPLDQVPIRYPFNMSRVSRLQMLGKYTPQSNKLIREAIMPTRSVLDLTNAKDLFRFQLGLAQALGIKVHHKMPGAIKKDLAKRLDALAPTVQILESWVENMGALPSSLTPTMISNFKEAGIALTPVALHALVEKARYNKGMSLNAFNTSIYVEADGISNGPINAMMLFTVGAFTAKWLKTIAKGGMFIGHDRMTMNEYFTSIDATDLYKTTANTHLKKVSSLRNKLIKSAPDVAEQLDHLLVLMDLFMGSDMSFKDGVLTIDRGLTKNPLTITLYGSGAKGIAGNLVQSLTDALYERMSQTIEATSNQGMSPAEAMFGKQSSSLEEAQEKFAKFEKAFKALTTTMAVLDEDVGYILESVPETERSEKESSLIEFTLSQQELFALRENMHLLFVTPLTYAIKDTVGDSLLQTTKLLRKATQVQSIFLAHAFKAELAKVLLEKGKDPSWNRNDFLTVEEVNKIKASIAHLAPNIVTEDQVFSIATGLVSPVGATTFGSALDGSFRSDPYLHAPKNAGVSGIPYMTIGAGDGLMMQLISTYSAAIEGTLKIFDGMNMPLDKIEEGSRQANAAVFESWSRNPLKAVYESFLAFSKVADTETLFEEMRPELSTALIGFSDKPPTRKQIMDEFNALPGMLNWAQQSIEARIRTLKKVNLAVDQMAAVGEPHVNKGTVVLDNSSYEAMEAQLNVIYEEEFADIQKAERVDRTLNAELLLLTESHASGVEVLPASKLGELTTQMPKTQAAVMKEIIDSLGAEGYRIVFGTPEQIAKFNDAEGLYGNGGNSSEGLKGYTNIDSKVIYLHNNTTETFTHELIHAATFQAVLAHYLGTGSRRASMAVLRIEELMNQFLDLESSLIQVNSDVRNSYADAKAAIEDYLLDDTPDSKAAALNEFMAWTLANESLANIAKNTTATKFARIRESVLSFLKQLFNIKQEVGKDMLSNLLFNSTILIRSQPTVKERFTRTVLMQNSTYGDNDRLVRINESLNKTIGQYLKEKVHPNKVDATVALQTGIMQAYRVSQSFMAHGFDMNMQEASTFNTIVATLATEAKIDANAMSTAQKLYVHAMKNLSYVDFMTDPESTDPNVEALAREKFDVLSGKYLVAKDGLGRSTLLPAFLALATVNEEFRAVLAKVPVPKNTHNNAGTLDALLENTGNKLTGKLSNRMSGVRKNSTNTQEAIDDLNTHIINIIETRETFFDQVASKSGGVIDRSNEIITNGMSRLSGKLITLAKKSEKPGTNKVLKFAAQASTGLAAVLDEEIAGAVADNLQGAINKSNLWTPVREMLGEFIGRTDSNANVYDMIKAVLTTVQQTRQQYREHLPVLIRKKFSRELSSKEWGGLYRVFAKGDITALRDSYTNAELLKLMVSPSAVNKAIDDLQNQLKATDSANYALLDEKMRQLAQFMIDGVPHKTLLRNASAISRLLMTGAKSGFTAPASVKQIDSLVSLYALQNQSKDDMASLRTLVQDENDGLTFVLSYLDGQRKGEAAKEATAAARLNVYKGYIPSQSSSESSIQVFDDSKYSELVAKSYERIGDYVGSSAESKRNRGYYYLPVASRSTFEQGIIQNVRETIGGVDATTGQTVAQTAGVIADPIAVRRILRRINSDTGVESLMPVFDDDGDVVAFERSLNPAMMERLGTESDLSKMLGVWRGRQVEESFARNYNETLIDHLGAMLDKDLAESANNIKEYVDLNKTKDPVLKKAVSLFSPATKKYAEQVFHGKFMVRKELLYDVLGYHAATVGDFWTGNGRWSPETQKAVRNIAVSVFGNAAYRKLVRAESVLQNAVSDVRVLIVVKSVIVPTANLISNVYQLISRGVPLASIIKGMGKKVAEVEAYTHARLREIEAEAELRAASGNPILERRLKTELQSIKDSYTRMSIWPLIKAGEFSGISDAGLTRADVELTSGRLQAYLEGAAQKLPGWGATMGRYALVTKDTALFQGLQKAVEYGDFLAKAVLFDDLTERKGMSQADALARITEEFVNYSRLSGRFRGALENNGLLWFYNFKLRIVKIALSTIRNNPVHALLATVAPAPTTFGSVGMPTSDNFFTKLLEWTLGNSVGPGQALDSISLNPWVNFTQ